jgi:beta-1,4-mannosyltransferase
LPDGNGGFRVAAFSSMPKNPYGQLLYAALAGAGLHLVPDPRLELGWLWRHRGLVAFLHFHWDELYYESASRRPRLRELRSWLKLLRYAGLLTVARLLGYRIIWTVHEVLPHESRSPRRDLLAARMLARSSHALVAHDRATAARAAAMLRTDGRPIAVVPHGSYVGAYPEGRPREAVRERLGLEPSDFVFLAFGNLRRYKRLDLLLEAFARVSDPDVALVIAGEFLWRFRQPDWERRIRAQLHDAIRHDRRIRYLPGRVPDEEVAELHRACDAAVLARSDGWTSGSMILALSHGLPVIAARQPAYVELLADGAAGWLYEPGGVASLAERLALAAADRERAADKAVQAQRQAAALDWRSIAAGTAEVMTSTLSGRRSAREAS